MMNRLRLMLFYLCLTILCTATTTLAADGNFEDAELVNEFITMSFSSSHPYDLRHTIPGEPDIDYPIYSAVPRTNFDCNGRHEGYYADIETRCQVFRICTNTDTIGRGFAFLCPNGTLFSQKNFVCDWYRNVDCGNSEQYYSKNEGNRIGSKNEIMETVRQMMEHPMKTISVALNRARPVTPQPNAFFNSGISSTESNQRVFPTTSAPSRSGPFQQNFGKRQPITLHQVESAAGRGQQSNGFLGSTRGAFATPAPPAFGPSTRSKNPQLSSYQSPSQSSSSAVFASPTASPQFTTESSASDDEQVYVSSLGELSSDPGASFNPQTARIIAADSSSSGDDAAIQPTSDAGSLFGNKRMNFAAKVNAGLNGLQVVNQNEVIAPEYVQNIVHRKVGVPERSIQPPSFEFASNINSLLDEVAYESELEGQTSMHVQLRTPSEGFDGSTRKPFRFLSRGFSYENTRPDGSYVYNPPLTAQRSSFGRVQLSTSTQSYGHSFLSTSLITTPAPVSSTEAADNSQALKQEEPTELSTSLSPKNADLTTSFNGRAANELVQKDSLTKLRTASKNGILDDSKTDSVVSLRFDASSKPDDELKSVSQPPKGNELEGGKNQATIGTANDIPEEVNDGDKAHANKRAEKLLIAGVKQTILDNIGDKSDEKNVEATAPIVPLYIRVAEEELPTSTEAALIVGTSSIPTATTQPRISSTTTTTTTTTLPPPTTTAQSIRRYTVNNVHHRHSTRTVSYGKRQNAIRSALRTTSTTTTTTTARPAVRSGSLPRTTTSSENISITSPPTRPTVSPRKRPTISRFSFGSGIRNAAASNSTSTTTTSSPNKKLAVRSSDKDVSDLTAVASTYNVGPKRDYNSIRPNSYVQPRRPSHRTKNFEKTTTTTTTTTKTTTTQPPRHSSSLPTPTLAPFSHDDLSSLSTSSTTPEPLPATYLSFNDLTKAIIDDSILQTFRKNLDTTPTTVKPVIYRAQTQAPVKQQSFFSVTTTPPSYQIHRTTTRAPFVPLKEFIASKFGAHYSPSPPNVSTPRPVTSTQRPVVLSNTQRPTTKYPAQQYTFGQDYASRTPQAPAVPTQQSPVQQRTQYFAQQQQQVPQQQYFHLRQQQVAPAQQFLQYPSQQAAPTAQPNVYRPVQGVQIQPSQQIAYRFPAQQQPQRATFQNQGQQILQRTPINPYQQQQQQVNQYQQFQLQRTQQQQQQQPAQIQIFPSQMTAAQMIPASNTPEVASINVRLPTNLAGLIPNTDLYDTRLSSESLGRAQKRIDQTTDDLPEILDSKSVYSGVSSYDVPLNSVGRLSNDITNLLRRLRRY